MNALHESEPKQPVVLDMRPSMRVANAEKTIQRLVDTEKAEKLQLAAEKLGKYSVQVVAEAGDPYTVIRDTEKANDITSQIMSVPEDKVIVSMQNTAEQSVPTDLSELYQSL